MMTAPIPPQNVRLEIDTFADLRRDGAKVAEWLTAAIAELLMPLNPIPLAELVEQARHYKASESQPWGPPWGARLLMGATGRGRTNGTAYTDSGWSKNLARLAAGELDRLRLTLQRLNEHGRPGAPGGWAAEVVLDDSGRYAHQLVVSTQEDAFADGLSRPIQQRWVRALQAGVSTLDARYAWITLDRTGDVTAHEEATADSPARALMHVKDWARGYFWANVLNPSHVDKLGGSGRVLREAPAAVREELSGGRIYLQLTDDLTEVPDEALAALKGFLAPVLQRTENRPYLGPPIRIA